MRSTSVLVAAAALSLPALAGPTTPCPADRPCLGLVLGGGGARGAAHVGVLEVMEELRVPVDFIVGTSMGAIVGGMYASGLSPDEMRRKLAAIDWEEAFTDEPPRRQIPFRLKEDDDRSLFKFEFGFGKGSVGSPAGLVAGQKLNFILSSLLIDQAAVRDFDELPVPFRAVAVDLVTGDVVVLDGGDLATAIRASMAFPVAFTPVEIDDRVLVDGGVLQNLPVETALGLGADNVIAVDVGSPLSEMTESPSALKLLRRTISVMSREVRSDQYEELGEQDLLILPDLEGIKTFEGFEREKLEQAVERGIAAARTHEEELRRLSVDERSYAGFLARQRGEAGREPLVVDRIEVDGVERVSPRRITHRLKSEPGEPVDLDVLRADLGRVYRIGEFEQVGFAIDDGPDGETVLSIEAHEKSWGPWFYRLGAAIAANFKGQGAFTGNVLLRRPNINALGAEWKSFLTVGDFDSIWTEFYQPLNFRERFFVAPRWFSGKDGGASVFVGNEEILADLRYGEAGLDLGMRLGSSGQFRLGVARGAASADPKSGGFPSVDEATGGWRARVMIDRLDNANFPRQGTEANFELYSSLEDLGADREYDRAFASVVHAFRARRWTQIIAAQAGDSLGSTLPVYDQFTLGGFLRLSGLQRNELRGSRIGALALIPYRQVGKLPTVFGGDFYIGGSLETGGAWDAGVSPDLDDLRVAVSLFAGVDTLLGPVYLGYGRADGGQSSWYLLVGRMFGLNRPGAVSRLAR